MSGTNGPNSGDRLTRESNDPQPPRDPRQPPRSGKRRIHWALRWAIGLFGALLALLILGLVLGAIGLWSLYHRYSQGLPDVATLKNYQPEIMSRVYASNSQLLAELASERRIYVPLSAIPQQVQQAFTSAEDQNFWTNPGIDPAAMARAAVTDVSLLFKGRRPYGASTITQQVARNILLDDSPTVGRKIRELIIATRIQQVFTKQQVLETYLNEINLGLSSYGVAAAAQSYFNTSLDDLTLPQAAFLAALPKAPSHYNPFRHPEAALARRNWVLDRMAGTGAITQAQANQAKQTPLGASPFRRTDQVQGADWFGEEVRRELVGNYGKDVLVGGYIVRTSLDPDLQHQADKALRDGLVAYDRKHGGWRGRVSHIDTGPLFADNWVSYLSGVARPSGMLDQWKLAVVLDESTTNADLGYVEIPPGALPSAAISHSTTLGLQDVKWARVAGMGSLGPVPTRIGDVLQPGDVVMVELLDDHTELRQVPKVQGALITLEPATGRVLALSGGWNFASSQFDRATQANRQPGSSFKPFVYLTALEQNIAPSQKFLDGPIVMNVGPNQPPYRPSNYENTFEGPMPLRVALERSKNLVTIRVAETVGLAAVADNAAKFHITDNMPKYPSSALGVSETTVLREASAYASIAAGGRDVSPTLIDSVQDRNGHLIARPDGFACDNCNDASAMPKITDSRAQIADPQSVFQLVTMMRGVVSRGTGTKAVADDLKDREIAGKTGTTQEFVDAWFGGFTPDLVTVVWVGFDNPTGLGEAETGGAIAAPIWHDFMAKALASRPKLQFRMPDGLVLAPWDSGFGGEDGSSATMVNDAFKPGQVPGASNDDLPMANAGTVDQNGKAVGSSAPAQPGAPGAPGAPATPGAPGQPANPSDPNAVDKSLGNLY